MKTHMAIGADDKDDDVFTHRSVSSIRISLLLLLFLAGFSRKIRVHTHALEIPIRAVILVG